MAVEFSFSTINSTLFQGLENKQVELTNSITNTGTDTNGNISTLDMLKLQQQLQQYTMMSDLTSTMNKSMSDSMKSVIQKAS